MKHRKTLFYGLSLLFLFLACVACLFHFKKNSIRPKSEVNATSTTETVDTNNKEISPSDTMQNNSKYVDWNNLLPSIKLEYKKSQLFQIDPTMEPVSIDEQADITGDGIPEALVNLGYKKQAIGFVTLVRLERDTPVFAQIKTSNNAILPLVAQKTVINYDYNDVILLPQKKAIYIGQKYVQGATDMNCIDNGVNAYTWNANTRLFEFDETLSSEIKKGYCR